jgi:hypothetical protein
MHDVQNNVSKTFYMREGHTQIKNNNLKIRKNNKNHLNMREKLINKLLQAILEARRHETTRRSSISFATRNGSLKPPARS